MAGRAAVVIPGARFGPYSPLLMYAGVAAAARRAQVHHLSWAQPDQLDGLSPDEEGGWVEAQVAPVVDRMRDDGASLLLIGKSLGTHAARLAAIHGLPAVWLTPPLTSDPIVAALRQAGAPRLLVGGTADELWDGTLARQLSAHVLEVDDADHGMWLPGPLAASAAVLGRVVTAIERFLDDVVWPGT
jgi:hypothetical protein